MRRTTQNRALWLNNHFGSDKNKPNRKRNRPALSFKAKRLFKLKYCT